MIQKLTQKNVLLIAVILFTVLLRTLFELSDNHLSLLSYTPLGAVALFSGLYLTKKNAFLVPLLAIVLSDIVLALVGGRSFIYDTLPFVYGAFSLMILVGKQLKSQTKIAQLFFGSFTVVFIHWFITDLGVWLIGSMYPMTTAGFLECLTLAIPFELAFLKGTFLYGALLQLSEILLKEKTTQTAQ